MESPRNSFYLLLCLTACLVVCFACSFTAFAAAPTRMVGPRGPAVPGPARGEGQPERSPSVPQKEPKREKDGMVVPTYPPEMKDEAPKSYMPVISAVPQMEKEGQGPGRVIVLPEKPRRKTMPYSQMMPRETIVYKEESGKVYAVTPEEEDAYQSEPKPVMVEEEETYYPKTYLKTVTPKVSSRTPMKMQHKADKMEMMKSVEPPTKTYVLVQAMEMEDQPASVMVQSMSPMDIYPAFTMPKKTQYVKVPQMREDMEPYESYMKMKMEEKSHQQHPDCGGMPCYTPQQVCEVPPCKVPSICPDCGTMKVVPSAAPLDTPMPHDTVEKSWSGFMQRYVDNKQNMVAAPSAKMVKEQAPRYYKQAPCVYGADCVMRQYEEEAVYHKPSVSGCKVEIHPMSSTPVVDCSPMASSSYSAAPPRQSASSPERDQMGMPSGSAPEPRWAMPSTPVPVHEAERMPAPMHPPQESIPAEEWKMPVAPPASVPGMGMGMPWTKSGPSAPQEKIPESFGRRRSYHYYLYPSSGSRERVVDVYYPSVYTYPRWRYVASYPPYYSYAVPAMTPVEYLPSPATMSDPVPVPQRTTTMVRSNSKVKDTVGEAYDH